MNGIQRFFLCVLSLIAIMICFPSYGPSVKTFALTALAICFGGLFILSLIVGLFGLDKYIGFNKFLTLLVWIVFTLYLLFCFPQTDKVSPINKIKHGQFPTKEDISKGAEKITFHFNFLRTKDQIEQQKNKYRTREEQIMNPDRPAEFPAAAAQPKPKPKPEKPAKVEIFMEDEAGYVDAQFMPED